MGPTSGLTGFIHFWCLLWVDRPGEVPQQFRGESIEIWPDFNYCLPIVGAKIVILTDGVPQRVALGKLTLEKKA